MLVTLIRNDSPANYIPKSLTTITQVSGYWKQDSSIEKPTIIIEKPTDLANINYFYIADWNRYYYIEDKEEMTGGQLRLTGMVDGLESFKTDILELPCIYSRQENSYNMYLEDSNAKLYSNPWVKCLEFPDGFTEQEFVLCVAGGE